MRKYLYCLFVFLAACSLATIDENKAKAVAESLMNDLKNENYANLNDYYTASFNESEPLEKKEEKYKRLKDVMGRVESYELISKRMDESSDLGGPKIELKYKMKCSRTIVTHTLVIINDEGSHKIAFQNFEN